MPTKITKSVSRETKREYTVLYASQPRCIIVTLADGDIIEFREKGRKQVFTAPISELFRIVVRRSAANGV